MGEIEEGWYLNMIYSKISLESQNVLVTNLGQD